MKANNRLGVLVAFLSLGILGVQHVAAQAPVNDNLANRTVLSGLPVNATGSNVNATGEADEFDQGFDDDTGTASIWYEWTAPSSGPVVLDTTGSFNPTDQIALDTNVGIFTSDSVNPTVHAQFGLPLVINDDGYDDIQNEPAMVTFLAEAGTTYYISIDTFSADANHPQGSVVINLTPGPARPANDDLATAQILPSVLPVTVTGMNRNATREKDEPFFDNLASFASLWYQWTPDRSEQVKIQFTGTDYNIIVAVFSGTTYPTLVEEVVEFGNTIILDVVAGNTYSIAVDGAYTFFQANGTLNMRIRPNNDISIINFGSNWEWLHPTDGVDPAASDLNFNTTWPIGGAGYDGPAFSLVGPGLLGYGTINFSNIVTQIGTPADGSRFTAYFRKDIELEEAATNITVRALIDDGAAIYLDGAIVQRVNYSADPDTYFELSDGVGNEAVLVEFSFPDIPSGDHVIAVSLHNQATNSSDLGFDMEMTSEGGGVVTPVDTDCDGASDDDEAIAGTDPNDSTDVFKIVNSTISTGGNYSVEWTSVAGKTYSLEFALDPASPAASWVVLDIIGGSGGTDSLAGVLPGGGPATGFLRVKVD